MPCWCKGSCPHIAVPLASVRAGHAAQAAGELRTALTAAPLCPEGNLMLAGLLTQAGQAQAAETHVSRAAVYGDPGRVALEGAKALRRQAKCEESAAAFHDAMIERPDDPAIAAGFIDVVEVSGELGEAGRLADAARKKFPASALVRRAYATVDASLGDYARAVETLSAPGEDMLPIEYLDRGRYLEKLGQHDRAWADWMTGKQLARDKLNHRYDAAGVARYFAALRAGASAQARAYIPAAPPLADPGPGPLFICGFPRSGTTLAETILSRHSGVLAGDELMGISEIIEALPAWCRVRVPYPQALAALGLGENADMPALLRDLYLKGSRRRIGWAPRKGRAAPKFFTDKMPLNELHLPLIRALFPQAPIFRMERHPLDVMVSCMSHWLAHGGFYASSLDACARHFLAVDSLVQFYRKELAGGGAVLPVPIGYADLVARQEETTRGMLGFAGLKFEAATLAPHKNPRIARTLSYNQVRKPVTGESIGRWKNYRAQLAPAVEILRPILERENYDC